LVFEHIAEYENYIDLKNDGISLKINNLLSDKNLNYLKHSIQDNQIKFKQIFNNFKVVDTNISKIKFETNNHHHGGTIIQTEFQKGVVDKNLKFQDISNLYISGSSTFPNSSIYNPTFTIIAMSLRLSNHILSKYVKPPQTKEN
jgi:choline dehydrogenase-like flavoprotein